MAYRQTPEVEARLQDNRSRILQAARALVSEGGWTEAQVASVRRRRPASPPARCTGTSHPRRNCSPRCWRWSRSEVDVLAAIARADGGATVRLHSAVATFVKRAMRNPRLAYALIAEPCDKEIDEVRLTYRAAISETIRAIVAEGRPPARCAPTCGRTSPPP